jgi:hypothetical protein
MKEDIERIHVNLIICILSILIFTIATHLRAESTSHLLRYGDTFPEYRVESLLLPPESEYLRLPEGKPFKIREVSTDLFLIEFLNKYCYNCQVQAPIFNTLYNAIAEDPNLKSKVKMVGVGVGNNRIQINAFKKEKSIPFPIIPDPDFKLYELAGEPKTPFTLLMRKNNKGEWVIVSAHLGVILLPEDYLEEIKAVLQYDMNLVKLQKEKMILPEASEVKLPIAEPELLKLVSEGMTLPNGKLLNVEKIVLPGNETVYLGRLEVGGKERLLFSQVVSQKSICDVCHDLHFIYTFDEGGKVVNFIPVHLTKYGNKEWDEDDIKKMRSRIEGSSLLKKYEFNPDVDAVSTATVTSLVIFDRLNHARDTLKKLKDGGYLK